MPHEGMSDLIRFLRAQFALDWEGIHGMRHWTRVRENGLLLADRTGADARVVELFAWIHDSKRRNDGHDPEHGPRAARFAKTLAGTLFDLDPAGLEHLVTACHGHSDGSFDGDVTVLTCWDADRLDLGRVGIRPRAPRLCTEAARDPAVLEWAYRRSLESA